DQRVLTHRPAIDHEALGEVDQMRRGVACRAVAPGAQRGIDHRRYRALAVGAGDMDRAECALGVAEPGDERGNVVEAELDPEVLEAEQIRQRIGQGSCGADRRALPGSYLRLSPRPHLA